ncbi:MAG: trehalose-6-phosphate synthase, partial [Bdellovibrionales bacterium]
MNFARFLLPLALALGLLTFILLPLADRLFTGWAVTDVKLRSGLIFSTLVDELPEAFNSGRTAKLDAIFTRLAKDERLIGIAYCDHNGTPRFQNNAFPESIRCTGAPKDEHPEFTQKEISGGPVMVGAFPVTSTDIPALSSTPRYILIVHDMSFVARRGATTHIYLVGFMLFISILAAVITMIIARFTLSRWVVGLRDYVRTGKRTAGLSRETLGIARELQQRIRQIEREQKRNFMVARPEWSAAALHDFVKNNLPSEQLIAVSYRQPYAHHHTPDGVTWSMPASGLVTALEPIMKACRGTWFAVASGDADKDVVDRDGAILVPPDQPAYKLKRLWLSETEENGFYAGLANEGLWPLCNIAYVKPHFRAADWAAYEEVNRRFAAAIVKEAKSDAPIVFVQDYHFGLLPKLIRERLPNAVIVYFWHIPWPNSELFGIMPWHKEFLEGMLAADIVGFHTQYHCNNFIDCVDTYVEALIDREHNTVRRGEDLCMIRPYPISIAWPDMKAENVPSIPECRHLLHGLVGIPDDEKIILGVERLDYIKGIPERLHAFSLFLERNPSMIGKVCFVQIASPSRSIIPAYANLHQEVEDMATSVNAKYKTERWRPIHLLSRNFGQQDVYRFYRGADVCVVSSLHDGMNLVAKEFVASRDDDRGVLILSQFAGSSRELVDALIVNPYNEEELANNLQRGLTMSAEEQAMRMKSMRDHVRSHNVYAWAAEILSDAARLHQRRRFDVLLQHL